MKNFDEITKEDLFYLGIGLMFGFTMVLIYRHFQLVNAAKKMLELQTSIILEEKENQAENPNFKEEYLNEMTTPVKLKPNLFPLRKGSQGENVVLLHRFLINDYDAEINEDELTNKEFGSSTLDAVKIHLKRDTISEKYFQKAIVKE